MTDVPFTDADGRAWRAYDYSIISGRRVPFDVGASGAAYRGFAPVDRGARRVYLFKIADDRAPLHHFLCRHLAASSLYWKDDPAHYDAMRNAGFANVGGPERVDPAKPDANLTRTNTVLP
jgi:hypothetical protein